MAEERPENPRDVAEWVRHLPLHAPRNSRQLFHLLAQYRRDEGVDAMLARVDFTGVTQTQICQAVLRRLPVDRHAATQGDGFDPRAAFKAALLSEEFRSQALPTFLTTFPELGRDVFIHVPKCAGTDLVMNLGKRQMPLPSVLEEPGWLEDDEFLTVLGGLTRALPFHDRVFVYGHLEFGPYLDRCGIRPHDTVFSIIRDPIMLMVSQANYTVGRWRQDPTAQDPDTAETMSRLGLAGLPADITDGKLKDLVVRALLHPDISFHNQACRHLGHGVDRTFEDAIDLIVSADVEITTTEHYNPWLKERWNIPSQSRHNASEPILTLREAQRLFSAALFDATTEDQKLYDLVSWAIAQTGQTSVRGSTLARLVAPRDVVEFANELTRDKRDRREGDVTGVFAVEEPPFVERYLTPLSVLAPNSPTVETMFTAEFGAGGEGRAYLGMGWSGAEKAHTWSDGDSSTIRLPPCPHGGAYTVRLIGRPFVVPGLLPQQRLDIEVNGQAVGTCSLRDFAVVEFDIPPHMTVGGAPLEIMLRYPDAARPRPLNGANDDRVLGFCAYRLTFSVVRPGRRT